MIFKEIFCKFHKNLSRTPAHARARPQKPVKIQRPPLPGAVLIRFFIPPYKDL